MIRKKYIVQAFSVIVMLVLLVTACTPRPMIPVTGSEQPPTPTLPAAEQTVTWNLELDMAVPQAELSAMGGEAEAGENILQEFQQSLAGEPVTLDVQSTGELDGGSAYTMMVSGNSTFEQLRQVLYVDLAPQMNMLSEPFAMTINGQAAEGQSIPVVLESNPSTGYMWQVGEDAGAFVEETETTFEAKEGTPKNYMGAPMRQTLHVKSAAGGQSSLKLVYSRPWEGGANPTRRLSVEAGVLPAVVNLSNPVALVDQLALSAQTEPQPEMVDNVEEELSAQSLPAALDWRTEGVVPAVRNQASCGSCWAFSTVGVMESAMMRAGVTADLSEQFLVSCTQNYNSGCSGGYTDTHMYHYNRLAQNQTVIGAVPEAESKYIAKNGTCGVYSHPYQLANWKYVTGNWWTKPTETQMKEALVNYGPIGAAVCVGNSFSNYSGGYFSTNESSSCNGGSNHAIVLVGWETYNGSTYWILRNSWGAGWGENGYMRIKSGISSIGQEATYVEFEGSGSDDPDVAEGPENDDIDKAINVTDTGAVISYTDTRNTTSATSEDTDPTYVGLNSYYKSVWYSYTPSKDGLLKVDTYTSDYNTLVGVWSGTVGSLILESSNNDAGGTLQSLVQTGVTAGTKYYIEVVSTKDSGGVLKFNLEYAPVVGSGTFEESEAHILYAGDWSELSQAGASGGAVITSSKAKNSATLAFEGTRVSVVYSRLIGGSTVAVYLDNSIKPSAILAQNTRNGEAYQLRWSSGELGEGTHTIKLMQSGKGTANLDAFVVEGAATAAGIETVDDATTSKLVYKGFWQPITKEGALNNTLSVSSTNGDVASLAFTGSRVEVTYSKVTGGGLMMVYLDSETKPIGSINQKLKSGELLQQNWSSGELSEGSHIIRFVHKGGGTVNLDAITISAVTVSAGLGSVDDGAQTNLNYKGFWNLEAKSGALSETIAYSQANGDTVSLNFNGNRFSVIYAKQAGGGSMQVYLDNETRPRTVINQKLKMGELLQQRWSSGSIPNGDHKVTLKHIGGGIANVDSIVVSGATLNVTPGIIDNPLEENFDYKGYWELTSQSGALNDTIATSRTNGDQATIGFTGSRFSVLYTMQTGGGNLAVYLDNDTRPLGMITQKIRSGSEMYQQVWSSGELTDASHVVRLVHKGAGVVTLDGIIFRTSASASSSGATLDDASIDIDYKGFWQANTGIDGAANGTLTRSQKAGSSATVKFNGSKVILNYSKEASAASIKVAFDGGTPILVNLGAADASGSKTFEVPAGDHVMVITHQSGSSVNIDLIEIQ